MYRGCARIDKFGDSEVFKSMSLLSDPCLMRYYDVWMVCSMRKCIKCEGFDHEKKKIIQTPAHASGLIFLMQLIKLLF